MCAGKSYFFAALLHFAVLARSQYLDGPHLGIRGICESVKWEPFQKAPKAEHCVVIVGNIFINLQMNRDFDNVTFPNLREVTGYVALYKVPGLTSLSKLFPNLALIGGQDIVRNYALSVYNLPDLTELGLYNLLRISGGGVVILNNPKLCFVATINWDTLAPAGTNFFFGSSSKCEGSAACRCMNYPDVDYCWNRRKCQRLLTGPVAEQCHEQCLGCRKTDNRICTRCRHFTDNDTCVSKCPPDKVILTASRHCLTKDECYKLFDGKSWIDNGRCIYSCPKGYIFQKYPNSTHPNNGTCVCNNCYNQTCPDHSEKGSKHVDGIKIFSIFSIRQNSHCNFINGSLNITLDVKKPCMEDLELLKNITVIEDFLFVSLSPRITSLSFLSNLRIIKGKKLWNGKYSIVIIGNENLRTLFPEKTAKRLKIEAGAILAYNNPQLCMQDIENFHKYLKIPMGHRAEISSTSNGYLGECQNINIPLNLSVKGERYAEATFKFMKPQRNTNLSFEYYIDYREIVDNFDVAQLLSYCGDIVRKNIDIKSNKSDWIKHNITNLKPATSYALYVEAIQTPSIIQSLNKTDYGRSKTISFTTMVGKPPPPFIVQIAAVSAHSIALNWLNHLSYIKHIKRYLLDISIINYDHIAIDLKNHCKDSFTLSKRTTEDYSHVIVRTPPKEYGDICICNKSVHFRENKMSSYKPWKNNPEFKSLSPVHELRDFEVCDIIDCSSAIERNLLKNTTIAGVLQTFGIELEASQTQFKIDGLLPFHDYKLRLRACTGPLEQDCGSSSRETIRTQMIRDNDLVNITKFELEESHIKIEWDPPLAANGYVLAYVVQIKRPDIYEYCINRVEHEKKNRTFNLEFETLLTNYSVRICVSSMAADRICGNWLIAPAKPDYHWLVAIIACSIMSIVVYLSFRLWRTRMSSDDRVRLIENIELEPIQN